ncbi:MAG: AI-2E family transporter [Proteobacteria bacterium]|nr:AI-2E family transporter [Pseudomonadota bacterium]
MKNRKMKLKDKIILFVALTALILWFLSTISSILAPFIVAIIVAYFLDPLAGKIEKKFHLSRSSASLIIIGIFIIIIIGMIKLLLPILYAQFLSLVNSIPTYINTFSKEIYPKFVVWANEIGFDINGDVKSYLTGQDIPKLLGISNNFLGNLMKSGVVIINIFSLIFITPILIFYILKDWNLLVDKINKYLPSNYAKTIRRVVVNIDATLSGYLRGQFHVCFILGILYAIGLSVAGLNFGFLIGFLTGIMSFIPYVGMLVGVFVAVVVGFFQWGADAMQFGILAGIFLVGQFIEGNFLTPKLVGNKVGLHPVWIIFGLFAFGVLFGFVGILLAVPMTAIIGVIVKFLASTYKKNFVK